MRTVYIHKQGPRIFSDNAFSAALGFASMGFDIREIEPGEDLYNYLNKDKESFFVGGINAVRDVFNALGIKQPEIDNPHICLPLFLGRDVQEVTWEQIESLVDIGGCPFFIKPLEDHKLFTGYVVKSKHDLIHAKNRIKPHTRIIISECVNFVSEYRCFVHKGKLVGCKNYAGDFKKFPNFEIIEEAITQYKNQPIGYSIDFGVTDDDKTLLIEMNDGFGLSAYGLNKVLYCKILMDRWDEIVNKKVF